MRSILNISMPKDQEYALKQRVKKRGFLTISEYIRFLIEIDTDLISSESLLKMATESNNLYKKGKLKKLSSLSNLLK